jgi:hypothetical protein
VTTQFDAARRPILGIFGLTVRPGVSFGTMKADIPLVYISLLVAANTRKVSAKPELVVKTFDPLMT